MISLNSCNKIQCGLLQIERARMNKMNKSQQKETLMEIYEKASIFFCFGTNKKNSIFGFTIVNRKYEVKININANL